MMFSLLFLLINATTSSIESFLRIFECYFAKCSTFLGPSLRYNQELTPSAATPLEFISQKALRLGATATQGLVSDATGSAV